HALTTTHAGDVPAAFERTVREAIERREFWQAFTEVPAIQIDTAEIARAWKAARDGIMERLKAKQAAPLEPLVLGDDVRAAAATYEEQRFGLDRVAAILVQANEALALVKEEARAANV